MSRCHGSKISGGQQTENVNSQCLKLHRSYSISFNLSNGRRNFQGLNQKGAYLSLERERENFCVVFTNFIKRGRETRNHSCDRRATTAKKCKRNVMHVQSCCFANLNLFFVVIVAVAVAVVVA